MPPQRVTTLLSSWKEIADYLGVSLRTAQTWERDKALPVQRMPGEKGRVAASTLELDDWRRSALSTKAWWVNPKYLQAISVISTSLLLIVGVIELTRYVVREHNRQPVGFRFSPQSLTVIDANGKDLWRKVFQEPLEPAVYSGDKLAVHRKSAFADIDRDGDLETLFVYSPVNSMRNPAALYCFSRRGEERWNFAPALTVSSNGNGHGRTHVINDLLVSRPKGSPEPEIFLLDCQLPGHAATLFALSPRGEIKATFAHKGHLGMLETADVDGCGEAEILMGGFAAERNEAELIVLQMPRNDTVSSHPVGELARSTTPPILREKAILAFPRTCVNKKMAESNRIGRIEDSGEFLTVVVSELSEEPSVEVTYQLDRKLEVNQVWFSDALRNLHRTLEAQGVLNHALTEQEISAMKNITRLPTHTNNDVAPANEE